MNGFLYHLHHIPHKLQQPAFKLQLQLVVTLKNQFSFKVQAGVQPKKCFLQNMMVGEAKAAQPMTWRCWIGAEQPG